MAQFTSGRRLWVKNKLKVQALNTDCELDSNLKKVNKSELLFVDNPQYENIMRISFRNISIWKW
jgi:hypothetical protein